MSIISPEKTQAGMGRLRTSWASRFESGEGGRELLLTVPRMSEKTCKHMPALSCVVNNPKRGNL